MKINISDVSVIIPLRVDCQERLTNINTILGYITGHTNASIFVLEADAIQKGAELSRLDISYRFIKDDRPVLHHTRYRNEMIKTCTTPYIAVWDVDAIPPLDQLHLAVEKLRSKEAFVSWPYDGIYYHVPQETCREFASTGNIESLTSRRKDLYPMFGALSNGGIFMADREKYMEIGMENERIYGWGPEDVERLKRITILGLPVFRARGELYHLWHPRGINRLYADPKRDMMCFREYLKVCRCSQKELLDYIQTWNWIVE